MSSLIIKKIKITNKGTVIINMSDSNIFPRIFHERRSDVLEQILLKKGKEEVEKEILFQYFLDNFKAGNNIYEKTIIMYKMKYSHERILSDDAERAIKEQNLKDKLFQFMQKIKKERKIKAIVEYNDKYIVKKSSKNIFLSNDLKHARIFTKLSDVQLFVPKHMLEQIKVIQI